MSRSQLQRQVVNIRKSLFDQGFLDDQFIQLEDLQDEANPYFVEECVTLFYTDSVRLIHNIEQTLDSRPVNFNRLEDLVHQFKGSCSSIGAKKVKNECTHLREYCMSGNAEGCIRTFQRVKQELAVLRRKLESYFQMARQAGASANA
uniref:Histidine-containing phosphotransfer protein n=1 Tax=Kalanchoe fedtschenkoi TaxID=63787 RepID=A0A7N0V264_KALFE